MLDNNGNTLYEPENGGEYMAVIAEFRNEPGDFSIINWRHVRASIAFYDEHGAEVADVGRASWLENGTTIDFPSHVTRKLIVAVFADKKWLAMERDEGVALGECRKST